MISLEDILVWAGGIWMFREDYDDSVWMSDDYWKCFEGGQMKVSISRNKREGYYAGYYRPCYDFQKKTKRRHRRWSWWAMNEFYPPIWGKCFEENL